MNFFKTLTLLLFLSAHSGNSVAQYSSPGDNVYIGFGTALSSYLGGYFGNAYQMRVLSDPSDYYDDYNDYYGYNSYGSYDNYYTIWSPLEFDIITGYRLNDNMSLELSSTFLFHPNGRVDPQFVTGSINNRDYIDRNSISQLYAVPLSAAIKFHSSGADAEGFYLKFGPAMQYTSEEYDRIREYYYYEKYYEHSYFSYIGTVSESKWLPGFTASMGAQFSLTGYLSAYTELDYSYFKINGNNLNALALERAKEAQLFSLKTVVYLSF